MHIQGVRADGYHLVHTVMQAVSLRETVEVWHTDRQGITLTIEGADLADDEHNTARKAAKAFEEAIGVVLPGIAICLHKRVPIGAGLAGGSADAAAVLVALNALTHSGLSVDDLYRIGAKVGADVPFCVHGGTAIGTGTGTELSPLPPMPECRIVIAKPADGISTPAAYRLIDAAKDLPLLSASQMEQAIRDGNLRAIAKELCNAFDSVTSLKGVTHIKTVMRDHQALGCQMTGSGSAVFGLFDDDSAAQRCYQDLQHTYRDVFLCSPDPCGAVVDEVLCVC